MRRYISAAIAAITVFAAVQTVSAQDASLDRIERKNTALETIEAHLNQTRTLQSGKEIVSEGTLYFSSPDRMSMIYSVPESDLFIIDGKSLYMARGKSRQLYDTEKNALMRSLSSTLLYCVRGQLRTLAQENNAEISVEDTSAGCKVTLNALKRSARGYSQIVLLYDRTTSVLVRMELVEFSRIRTVYEMSDIRTDITVDEAVYSIPEL